MISPFALTLTRLSACRQIFGLHPEIDGVLGHVIQGKLGFPNGPARSFSLQHFAVGLSQHLDPAQGIFPIVRPKVEIVQAQGFSGTRSGWAAWKWP